jgi:hypothetical protein
VVGGVAALVIASGVGGFFIGKGTAGENSDERNAGGGTVASIGKPLEAAFEACKRRDSDRTLELQDSGETIVIDTGSEYGDPAGMNCVLKELDTPQSITAQMDRTTAMMGVQDAEDGGIEYSWSYHPDNGVNMVITAGGN